MKRILSNFPYGLAGFGVAYFLIRLIGALLR